MLGVTFVGLAIVNFYLPARQHFWGGGDEHVVFTPWADSAFSHRMDLMVGRPLEEIQVWMAELMTPDRMEGFLLLATGAMLLNALLVSAILSQFFRDDWLVPLLGGALYLVNPCDGLRYYVIWAANCYLTSLFFCLLAIWLYLKSGALGSRLILVALALPC